MVSTFIKKKISEGKKILALLIDPEEFHKIAYTSSVLNHADLILLGGSTIEDSDIEQVCTKIKELSDKPIILFPGSFQQLTGVADATLFLNLLSGRNPDYLIGQQMQGAPLIEKLDLETLSCAYLLIGEDNKTSVSKVTGTQGMSKDDPQSIIHTALAGNYMGMKHCYLEAGSGASLKVPLSIIAEVKKRTGMTLWVGGGIHSLHDVQEAWNAGADIVVIGTWIEESPEAIFEISKAINRKFTQTN